MSAKNRNRLFVEALEERAVPAVSYTLDGAGDLFVNGLTTNATYSITSTAAGVTITDGASTQTFSVFGTLSVNLTMTNAAPRFNYLPGVSSSGPVSLKVTSFSPLQLDAAGTAAGVNVNGGLSITTGGTTATVAVANLNPAGLTINNSTGGSDTVTVGFSTIGGPTGPVTVQGNLSASNVNQIGLGALGGPAVTVQGIASISTHLAPNITQANPNIVDIENNTTIQGSLIATLNGPFELFSTMGVQQSNVVVSVGNGENLVLFQDPQVTFGNVTVTALSGSAFDATVGPGAGGLSVNGLIGGNFTAVAGNGRNDVDFHATILGNSVTYYGGSGIDNVKWGADLFGVASAWNAGLNFNLNAGNDTMTVQNSNWTSALFDGGFGTNVFSSSAALNPRTTVKNY